MAQTERLPIVTLSYGIIPSSKDSVPVDSPSYSSEVTPRRTLRVLAFGFAPRMSNPFTALSPTLSSLLVINLKRQRFRGENVKERR